MDDITAGIIPTYKVEDELELMMALPDSKPSKRFINTKKGRKAVEALIDLEKNHNVSWYRFLKERSSHRPNDIALFYRGTEVTYSEMLERAENIARSLVEKGVKPGDEIPVCMTNCPELVYILIAANAVGAKLNIFGEQFNPVLIDKILTNSSHKVMFVDDSRYKYIKESVENSNIENKIMISLSDSLPEDPTKTKGYEKDLADYYKYENKVNEYKSQDSSISSFKEFEEIGKNSKIDYEYNGDLETDFLITYTSGSTIAGMPKAIVHKNRSLIVSGRFHDCELSGNPDMKDFSCLAHIPPESNTDLIACISDILLQGWKVCLEPEYDHEKALDYIILNKPNYLNMTTSFFIEVAKQYLIKGRFRDRLLDFIFTPFAVGEKLSPGEEKFINKFLRIAKAGSGVPVNGFRLPFVTLGTAAGDCEHGAIFYTLWKKFFEMKSKLYGVKECGMYPEAYVNATVLKINDKGEYEECDYGEPGLIVSNSYSNMAGYKDNEEATNKLLVKDNLGRTWLSCNTYGYIDKLGGVHIHGRKEILFTETENGPINLHDVEEIITKDTKKILSCQMVNKDNKIYAIIQPQAGVKTLDVVKTTLLRLRKEVPMYIFRKIELIVLPFENSFPLTHSGKRELDGRTIFKNEEVPSLEDEKRLIFAN